MIRYIPRYEKTGTPEQISNLSSETGISPMMAEILLDRGLDTPEKINSFFNPTLESFHNPFLFNSMGKAVELIRDAVDNGDRITIYGDYDADGVTSTCILLLYLRSVHANVDYYIPNRQEEGYGLHMDAIDEIAEAGTKLIVTVDCGITNKEEIGRAKELGITVVVTDHHEAPEELPDADVILNPRCCPEYPFSCLCGAGVAWKLVCALGGYEYASTLLDLAALGTVADLVPLQGENRLIVTLGIRLMNEKLRPGLSALVDVSGLTGQQLSAGHLGFQIGPRINAGGRMDSSSKSVEMLVSEDYDAARQIALDLDANNSARREIEQKMMAEAEQILMDSTCLCDVRGIVLWNRNWAPGVLGIVASRLQEKYHRPVVLFGGSEDKESFYGSARSVPNLNIVEALQACSAHLNRYGGHAQAAGMETLNEEETAAFAEEFCAYLESCPEELFFPYSYYDATGELQNITPQLVEEIESMSPMGVGNPTPVIWVHDTGIQVIRTMGDCNQHFSARLTSGEMILDAVAFRQKPPVNYPGMLGNYDVLCVPTLNEWRGRSTLQCQIKTWNSRKSMLEVDRYLRQSSDDFRNALWTRFWMSLQEEDMVESVEIMDDIIETAVYLLQESAFGTLVFAGTPEAAQKLIHHPLMDGVCSNGMLILPQEEPVEPGMNCILAGRSFWDVKLEHYRRIVLLDGLVSSQEAGYLFRHFREGDGEILIGAEEMSVSHLMYVPDMDVEWFRETYKKLRHALQNGYTGNGGIGHITWLARILNVHCWKSRAALNVFRELGLVEYTSRTEMKLNENIRGLNLQESKTFRKLQGLEKEPGMPF